MKLDLACGQHCKPGFTGIDFAEIPGMLQMNLLEPWPIRSGSIEELHCSHFIEHLPMDEVNGQDRFFWFFDQCGRILEPRGRITLVWPALQSYRAFMDPTHRRFIPLETLHYLSRAWRTKVGIGHYNVKYDWKLLSSTLSLADPQLTLEQAVPLWNVAQDYTAVLEVIK